MAEHLLSGYHKQLPNGITLIPSSGGVFEVKRGEEVLFSKKQSGHFPQADELDHFFSDNN